MSAFNILEYFVLTGIIKIARREIFFVNFLSIFFSYTVTKDQCKRSIDHTFYIWRKIKLEKMHVIWE